ncbi:hypothetical protein [Pedosphaera parvula]|nr:hypothetical protein [Pedosphaera parvula]
MNATNKVATQLPLQELWNNDGFVAAARERWLSAKDITNLLRNGGAQFVVADVGTSLHWIPISECFDFWKREVQPHLASPESKAALGNYPDSYCYFASEWSRGNLTSPIVVLEKQH